MRLDNWIKICWGNYIHRWRIEEYINISFDISLLGSTYIELPDELKNSLKGLINIKNNLQRIIKIFK